MLEVYRVTLETYPKVGYKTSLYRKALVESQSQLGIEPEILVQGSSSISIFLDVYIHLGTGPVSCKQPNNSDHIISWQCLIHKVSCEDAYFEAIATHQILNFRSVICYQPQCHRHMVIFRFLLPTSEL
ncbi:LOW QUALITY PROTEIN: hypothetical protein PanWU01x14_235250 [Parasponia andersonii]|uniref:Uncharacterized protein n=1 Tax=Parasponia andersonii TaxID=3476 RepID=A0A2P5BJ53_PARAD|nr:LOW QUALITY PROTEIN: hypothetical protein PanWU01x14_235250 [Parasponia andersonii]